MVLKHCLYSDIYKEVIMITKKYLKELEKRYIGKRIIIDDKSNVGTIISINSLGQLEVQFDKGDMIFLKPEDEFHEVHNWEL